MAVALAKTFSQSHNTAGISTNNIQFEKPDNICVDAMDRVLP